MRAVGLQHALRASARSSPSPRCRCRSGRRRCRRPAVQRRRSGQAGDGVLRRRCTAPSCGRGTYAEIEPLLMIRPPRGVCASSAGTPAACRGRRRSGSSRPPPASRSTVELLERHGGCADARVVEEEVEAAEPGLDARRTARRPTQGRERRPGSRPRRSRHRRRPPPAALAAARRDDGEPGARERDGQARPMPLPAPVTTATPATTRTRAGVAGNDATSPRTSPGVTFRVGAIRARAPVCAAARASRSSCSARPPSGGPTSRCSALPKSVSRTVRRGRFPAPNG